MPTFNCFAGISQRKSKAVINSPETEKRWFLSKQLSTALRMAYTKTVLLRYHQHNSVLLWLHGIAQKHKFLIPK